MVRGKRYLLSSTKSMFNSSGPYTLTLLLCVTSIGYVSAISDEICVESACEDADEYFQPCASCADCWKQNYSFCTQRKVEAGNFTSQCFCDHSIADMCSQTSGQRLDVVTNDEVLLEKTCYNNDTGASSLPPLRVVDRNHERFTVSVPNVRSLIYWRRLNITSFQLRLFCPEAVCTKIFDRVANDSFEIANVDLLRANVNSDEQHVSFNWTDLLKQELATLDIDHSIIAVSAEYAVDYTKAALVANSENDIANEFSARQLNSAPLLVQMKPLDVAAAYNRGVNTGLIVLMVILVFLFVGMILACITRRHTLRNLASRNKVKKKNKMKVHKEEAFVVYDTKPSNRREEEWKLLPTSINADKSEANSPVKTPQRNDVLHKYVDICKNATIVPINQFDLLEVIGQGQFGPIKRGYVGQKNECMVHCAKMPYNANNDESRTFFDHLDNSVKACSHPNVISFVGLCDHGDDLYIAMQLETGPNLRNLLRESRSLDNFLQYAQAHGRISMMSSQRLLSIMLGVARGMGYLEENKVLHDNLAAVNVVIGENGTPKIGGFGMATLSDLYMRQTEKNHKRLRWLPPETLTEHLFSLKSQIWSFGIVLWEIVTLGGTPYYELSDKDVMNQVPLGLRLSPPANCDLKLYNLMAACWTNEAELRPNFIEILRSLQDFNLNPDAYIDLTFTSNFAYEPIKQVFNG